MQRRMISMFTMLALVLLAGPGVATASAQAAAQQNCFNGTGPSYAAWAVYKPYNFAPGTYCFQGPPNLRMVFQSDGNFVYYQGSIPVWASNTANRGASRLAFQTDGNVVVYAGTSPLWASNHFAHSPTSSTTFTMRVIIGSCQAGSFPAITEQQNAPSALVWNFFPNRPCNQCQGCPV